MTTHAGLAGGRWRTLTLAEQLGNAGADVGRALRARRVGDKGRADAGPRSCAGAARPDPRGPPMERPRLREIARTRAVVGDFFIGDNVCGSTPELLDAYFTSFAVAARRDR